MCAVCGQRVRRLRVGALVHLPATGAPVPDHDPVSTVESDTLFDSGLVGGAR